MKARKKGGASAPKDKSMDYKNAIAKKYAGEESTRLALYESQINFVTGKSPRPIDGAGTYALYAHNMRVYNRKKTMQEKHIVGKMSRKDRKEYKAAKAAEIENKKSATVIEKTVYLVYPLEVGAHFYRTVDGANNQLCKKYDRWIMSELECDYDDIQIISMKESEAVSILETV